MFFILDYGFREAGVIGRVSMRGRKRASNRGEVQNPIGGGNSLRPNKRGHGTNDQRWVSLLELFLVPLQQRNSRFEEEDNFEIVEDEEDNLEIADWLRLFILDIIVDLSIWLVLVMVLGWIAKADT